MSIQPGQVWQHVSGPRYRMLRQLNDLVWEIQGISTGEIFHHPMDSGYWMLIIPMKIEEYV